MPVAGPGIGVVGRLELRRHWAGATAVTVTPVPATSAFTASDNRSTHAYAAV